MANKKFNYATVRTKRLIKLTFIQLLAEKNTVSNITVSELIKRAGINRGTFYNHFKNICSVVDELHDDVKCVFVNQNLSFKSAKDFDEYFDNIFDYLKENEENCRILLTKVCPTEHIKQLITEEINYLKNILAKLGYRIDGAASDNISFFTLGMVGMIMRLYTENYGNYDELKAYLKNQFESLVLR